MPHTPGPWTWAEGWGSDDIITGVLGPDRQVVVDPIDGDGDPAFVCKPEDIRLIAAAPEMYELLKEFQFVSGVYETTCPDCLEIPPDHAPDCRIAAVLKAVEGEV